MTDDQKMVLLCGMDLMIGLLQNEGTPQRFWEPLLNYEEVLAKAWGMHPADDHARAQRQRQLANLVDELNETLLAQHDCVDGHGRRWFKQ